MGGRGFRNAAWRALVAVMGCVAHAASAGEVTLDDGRYRYTERFRWEGNHAATIGTAPNNGTTTWWPEKDWDSRGDTAYISVEPLTDDGVSVTNAFHIDIHKAASADPRDGTLDNAQYLVGGNGEPGIGIMHLDYQDIVSARLRNPMLISTQQPGVVTFYAPIFNTTGHWFEVTITPSDRVIGGEHTSVPSVDHGLPFAGSNVRQPGPGHDSPASSLNVIAFGSADYPCNPGSDWRTRFGVIKTDASVRTHYVTPGMGQDDFLDTDPSQAYTLVHWKLAYYPDHVAMSADLDGNGSFTLLESWPASVPWPEVHVHLVAVGYQSTHHPAPPCNANTGHIREIAWRDVSVYPVKYARTEVFPKNDGVQQTPKTLGFVEYDLRDIQRTGTVNGVPQANPASYEYPHAGKYCEDAGYPCFRGAASAPALPFTLPAGTRTGLHGVRLLADLKDGSGANVHASVSARLNDRDVGRFPEHDAVLPNPEGTDEWVRRALTVPVSALQDGANTLQLDLENRAYVDRIELELLYGPTVDGNIFADGYESPLPAAKAQPYRHPRLGTLKLGYPLVPVIPGKLFHQCSE